MSTEINELLKALNKVQKELKPIEKTKANPFFKSKYADLSSVLDEVLPILAKHDLVLIQSLSGNEVSPVLDTIIAHAPSGQNIKSSAPLFAKELTPQGLGSAITYMRRYSLMAFLGISTTDEDDDGHKATYKPVQNQRPQQPTNQSAPKQSPPPPQKQSQPLIKPSTEQVKNAMLGVPNSIPKDIQNFAPGKWKPTEPQVKRLFAISKNNGWDEYDVREWCQAFFKVEPELLKTKTDYEEACEFVAKNPPDKQHLRTFMKEVSQSQPPEYLNEAPLPEFNANDDIPF